MTDPVEQLHGACEHGELATMRQLLDAGVSVEALNDWDGWDGRTPLHTAILNEQHEAVELLLERGANIEGRLFSWLKMPPMKTSQGCCSTAGLRLTQLKSVMATRPSTMLLVVGFSSLWAG